MGLVLVCACDDVLWASFQDRFEKFGSVLKPSESVSSLFTALPSWKGRVRHIEKALDAVSGACACCYLENWYVVAMIPPPPSW